MTTALLLCLLASAAPRQEEPAPLTYPTFEPGRLGSSGMRGESEGRERDLGAQPIARLLAALSLSAHDLVAASGEQITHKMVRRACKGRRLTPRVQLKLLNALNARTAGSYALVDLFEYGDERAERARPPAEDTASES